MSVHIHQYFRNPFLYIFKAGHGIYCAYSSNIQDQILDQILFPIKLSILAYTALEWYLLLKGDSGKEM